MRRTISETGTGGNPAENGSNDFGHRSGQPTAPVLLGDDRHGMLEADADGVAGAAAERVNVM